MRKQVTLAVWGALQMAAAQAGDGAADDSGVSLSGFGTLGVARTDGGQAQFARYNQARGATQDASIGLDTNLGLQASYDWGPRLSATAQVLTRKTTLPAFSSELTWAFVRVALSDELTVRAGRVVLPLFLISDNQNLGYANSMMRPPVEVYGQAPIENIDGVDLGYRRQAGGVSLGLQAYAGVSRGRLFVPSAGGSVASYRAPALGGSLSAEYGPVLVRLSQVNADLKSADLAPLNQLTALLRSAGYARLGDDLNLDSGKKIRFTSFGATYDRRGVIAQGEYAWRRAREPVYVPDTNAWYAMGGYRAGKMLVYYARAAYAGAGASAMPPPGLAPAGAVGAAVGQLLESAAQRSQLIGLRWDFAQSAAFKFQLDRVRPRAKSGSLIFALPNVTPAALTVVGVTCDFIF